MNEDGPGASDDVEDVSVVDEFRMLHGSVRVIMELRVGHLSQLHQVAQRQHSLDLEDVGLLVQAELGGEHPAVPRRHAARNLQPNDRRELAVAHLGLDHGEQVARNILVAFGIGVPSHAEELAAHGLHAREEQIEVVSHHALERHEDTPLGELQQPGHAGAHRDLQARQGGRRLLRIAQLHQQVQGEVRDEGERMGGIRRLRRHQRQDVLVVVVTQLLLLMRSKRIPAREHDVVFAQLPCHPLEDLPAAHLHLAHQLVALADLLPRREAVDRELLDAGDHLLLEASDALHDEAVEVGAGDRDELDALEKRPALVLGLVEHARVEAEPGELAVEQELGPFEIPPAARIGRLGRAGTGPAVWPGACRCAGGRLAALRLERVAEAPNL